MISFYEFEKLIIENKTACKCKCDSCSKMKNCKDCSCANCDCEGCKCKM